MSSTAKRFDHSIPLSDAAWKCFHKSGYLFAGAPALADFVPLEGIHGIAACMGRPLDERELRALVKAKRTDILELVGGRRVMKVLVAHYPRRMERILRNEGVLKTANTKGVVWSAVYLPIGKFNEAALYDRLNGRNAGVNGHNGASRGSNFNNCSTRTHVKKKATVLFALQRQPAKEALRQMRFARPSPGAAQARRGR